MQFTDVPVPEIYKESADFRFFLRWIELSLTRLQYQTDNLIDLLDPLRCPTNLLWLLADTCGYKYDDRASVAFNRLVILYFARMIRSRGCKNGMTLAAQLNLDQFNLDAYAKEKEILSERLEDTSIPVNSVSITSNVELGYIDIVYYSEKVPTDICIEYVRPLGMYCFQHAGVDVNARTKISIDARLTNLDDGNVRPGPTFIAHYRRDDYARLQNYLNPEEGELKPRRPVYNRNMKHEKFPAIGLIDPGYRSLFSLQLSNNAHIVKSLLPSMEEPDQIFSLGYEPQELDVTVTYPKNFLTNGQDALYNLRVDRELEESFTPQVYTVESGDIPTRPRPAVNPIMAAMGDAMVLNDTNTKYSKYNKETGKIEVVDIDGGDNPEGDQ